MLPTLQQDYQWEISVSPKGQKKSVKEISLITDSVLWDHFRNGSDHYFEKIYRDYVNVLFSYGKKFCKDRELIRDCVQDFFIYLREHREGLGPTNSIRFYLFRAFRRRLLVQIEKVARHHFCEYGEVEFELEVEQCEIEQSIHQEHLAYSLSKINMLMQKLAPREREALFFYYKEQLPYHEIAEIMQFSQVSSARRLVYTALKNMRTLI